MWTVQPVLSGHQADPGGSGRLASLQVECQASPGAWSLIPAALGNDRALDVGDPGRRGQGPLARTQPPGSPSPEAGPGWKQCFQWG